MPNTFPKPLFAIITFTALVSVTLVAIKRERIANIGIQWRQKAATISPDGTGLTELMATLPR